MATVMAFHDVDNVEHWLASSKREEIFGPIGVTARTFVDPEGTNGVGLILEIPDMDAFQDLLQSDVGVAAMKYDGVRPETIVMRVAS